MREIIITRQGSISSKGFIQFGILFFIFIACGTLLFLLFSSDNTDKTTNQEQYYQFKRSYDWAKYPGNIVILEPASSNRSNLSLHSTLNYLHKTHTIIYVVQKNDKYYISLGENLDSKQRNFLSMIDRIPQ